MFSVSCPLKRNSDASITWNCSLEWLLQKGFCVHSSALSSVAVTFYLFPKRNFRLLSAEVYHHFCTWSSKALIYLFLVYHFNANLCAIIFHPTFVSLRRGSKFFLGWVLGKALYLGSNEILPCKKVKVPVRKTPSGALAWLFHFMSITTESLLNAWLKCMVGRRQRWLGGGNGWIWRVMLDQIGKRLNAITKANFGVYSVGRESNLDDLQQDITNEIGF